MRRFTKFVIDNFFNKCRYYTLFLSGLPHTAPAGGNLLLEDGFDILLETGSHILLEGS